MKKFQVTLRIIEEYRKMIEEKQRSLFRDREIHFQLSVLTPTFSQNAVLIKMNMLKSKM